MEIDFVDFVMEAKVEGGYASGKKPTNLTDGGKELKYQNGIWRYRDRWYGDKAFVSQEIIWKDYTPFWAMNTMGRVENGVDYQVVYSFLREALKKPETDFPIRGPFQFSSIDFDDQSYGLDGTGDITDFTAEERIMSIMDNPIYTGTCLGGLL